jgi:hypothetical protein
MEKQAKSDQLVTKKLGRITFWITLFGVIISALALIPTNIKDGIFYDILSKVEARWSPTTTSPQTMPTDKRAFSSSDIPKKKKHRHPQEEITQQTP